MKQVIALETIRTPPDRETLLSAQGIPPGAELSPGVEATLRRAVELYAELAEPRAIWTDIDAAQFEAVYRGEGLNAHRTPLERIFPRAAELALFAVTLGDSISRRISDLFGSNEPALGYALDSIASERADAAAEQIGRHFARVLGADKTEIRVLAYSPGYCGWHVSGQRRLFEYLRPQRIGITLNSSCLMQPLKSVSGVLVAGEARIHEFDNDFDFCACCSTHQCRQRIASLGASPDPVDAGENECSS